MAITAISRDWGVDPSIVRIVTTDNLAAITTAGYLTAQADEIFALNKGAFTWVDTDYVLISYSGGEGFFIRDVINATFDAAATVPGTLSDTLADGEIFVGSAANVATGVAMTGDIAITNAGVTSIAAGAIVNADVNAAAAIAYSKLAALPSTQILVGSAGNVATAVAMTGDVAISNTGVTTIQAGAIDKAMLSAGIQAAAMIVFAGNETTVGGAAAEAFNVPGIVAATDLAFVQVVDDGTANVTVLQAVCTNDTLTVTFSANPGNDCIFNYQIVRATA